LTVMFVCKVCGNSHSSGRQMDEGTFNGPGNGLENIPEQCPFLHKVATYNKPDYFFAK
jgi:hypothetical protein